MRSMVEGSWTGKEDFSTVLDGSSPPQLQGRIVMALAFTYTLHA
jgi:hypothetical protein